MSLSSAGAPKVVSRVGSSRTGDSNTDFVLGFCSEEMRVPPPHFQEFILNESLNAAESHGCKSAGFLKQSVFLPVNTAVK